MTFTVVWCCFILLAILHVYACFAGKKTLRYATKPLLVLYLSVVYAVFAKDFSSIVMSALILGFFGDVLLMGSDKYKWMFFAGALSFGLGHIAYIWALVTFVSPLDKIWVFAAVLVLAVGEAMTLFSFIKKNIPKSLRFVSALYGVFIGTFAAMAAVHLAVYTNVYSVLIMIGVTLFIASDSMLVYRNFAMKGETPVMDGLVMLTYIAAQALLTYGFIFK